MLHSMALDKVVPVSYSCTDSFDVHTRTPLFAKPAAHELILGFVNPLYHKGT